MIPETLGNFWQHWVVFANMPDPVPLEDILEFFNGLDHRDQCIGLPGDSRMAFDAGRIPAIEAVRRQIHCRPDQKAVARLYYNPGDDGYSYGEHVDHYPAYYWQMTGQTRWTSGSREWTMNPGDWLYVPMGVDHTVRPLGARVSVRFELVPFDPMDPYKEYR
jgi:mannose-6-phosphate isomerase-like protein (cupin superfamily)